MNIIERAFDLVRRKSVTDQGIPWQTQAMGNSWLGNQMIRQIGLSAGSRRLTEKEQQIMENLSWVYICVNFISNEIGKTKVELHRGSSYEDSQALKIKPLWFSLFERPFGLYGTLSWLTQSMSMMLDLTGEMFLYNATDDNAGKTLTGLVPVNPSFVKPKFDHSTGEFIGWQILGAKVGVKTYPAEAFTWACYPRPDTNWRGMSPIEAIAANVDINTAIKDHISKLLKNDSVPSMTVTPKVPMDKQSRLELKQWANEQTGKKGGVQVYPFGLDVLATGANARELDYTGGQKVIAKEIFYAYNIPEIILSGMDANRSTFQQALQHWLDTCITPRLSLIENAITNQVIHRFFDKNIYLKFERRKVQVSEDARLQDELLLKYGVQPPNYFNQRDGLPLTAWGNEPYKLTRATVAETQAETEGQPAKGLVLKITDGKKKDWNRKAEWKTFDTLAQAHEGSMSDTLVKCFNRQRQQVIDRTKEMDKHNQHLTEAIFDHEAAQADMAAKAQPHIFRAIKSGYRRVETYLGKAQTTDGNLHEFTAEKRAHRMATLCVATTREKIKALLEKTHLGKSKDVEAPVQEISIETFMDDVNGLFDDMIAYRPDQIAATEMISALNQGAIFGYKDGGVTRKEWLSMQDDRVRHGEYNHELDGTQVGINETFPTGSAGGLQYPGDPNGEAGDLVNCRCTTLPVIE